MSPGGLVRHVPLDWDLQPEEVWLKRTAMSSEELERVEVMERVASGDLKVIRAAEMPEGASLSLRKYFQVATSYIKAPPEDQEARTRIPTFG
jgi:hypothetical protein